MLQDKKLRIMDLFFEEPSRLFQIREIARLTKIAHTSVKNYLQQLHKEGLIKLVKTSIYNSYTANEQNELFKFYKRLSMLLRIQLSGLIGHLEDKFNPKCMILFGSARKGDYVKKSDIDIFVQAPESSIDLARFEKKLKHRISLFFDPDINSLSDELFNNVVNGIKLSGYLKLR